MSVSNKTPDETQKWLRRDRDVVEAEPVHDRSLPPCRRDVAVRSPENRMSRAQREGRLHTVRLRRCCRGKHAVIGSDHQIERESLEPDHVTLVLLAYESQGGLID